MSLWCTRQILFVLALMTQFFVLAGISVADGCAKNPKDTNDTTLADKNKCWDDSTAEKFQLLTGIEQAGASSLPNQTNFFLSAYTHLDLAKGWLRTWGRIRLLGAPTGSTGDVVASFQDPSGALKNLPNSKVGQSVDFVAGVEVPFWGRNIHDSENNQRTTASVVLGWGATTPLSSQDVINKFGVPPAASQQCGVLVSQFSAANGYPAGVIARNPDSTSPQCLANGITVIAFNPEQRDSFLRKYGAGIRTTFRYPESEPTDKTFVCCEYGIVDFTVGQDEAITGGVLRHWVFRMDGVYPLKIGSSVGWLYLFGTAAIRLERNKLANTLILQADTTNAQPSDPNVALLPIKQPNKDFYRFGMGINIMKLFTKLSGQ